MREADLRPHRARWDEVNGRRVRSLAAAARDPAGGTVVLVPGLGALGYLLDTLDGCAAWARSFLVDVPGFGHRPPRPCQAEIGSIADTVSAWLSAVPDGPVVLVGHSTGAQVALHVAVTTPDRVRALVLLGPTFPPEARRLPGLVQAYLHNARHEIVGLMRANWSYYFRAGAVELTRYIVSAWHDEPERLVGRVPCPTLLVRGERDALVPQPWLDRLAAAAPDGRSVTVPGAHVFPYQQGGLTAKLIAEAAQDSR